MVETYEEEHSKKSSLESKKHTWALIIYSFSFSYNFNAIFFKDYHSIKDRNFEVFNGLRVLMLMWIMVGNTYIVAFQIGNSSSL